MFPSASHLFLDSSIWVDFTAVSRKENTLDSSPTWNAFFFFFFFLIEVDETETDWLTKGR